MSIIDIIEENIVPHIRQPLWENWYIKERIGSGSFSVVYRIEAKRQNRTDVSALKIQPIVADDMLFVDEQRKRSYIENKRKSVENESEIMCKLKDCPNIVTYEDESTRELIINGKSEGYYFLMRMELLDNVYSLIKKQKIVLSEKNVLKLASDIGNGIKAAHDKNIIHRDIKPENLFVSKNGVYKLGDFNISKQAVSTRSLAGTGTYMAPEVYRVSGNPYGSYTAQADIYSFGLCLYQMMNDGMLPFEENLFGEEAVEKRMSGVPLPPPKNVSEKFSYIILKACAFNPQERYSSINDMLYDLENLSQFAPTIKQVSINNNNNNCTQYAESTINSYSAPAYNASNITQYAGNNINPYPASQYNTFNPVSVSEPEPSNKFAKLLLIIFIILGLFIIGLSAFILLRKNDYEENDNSSTSVTSMYSELSEESKNISVSSDETEIQPETEPETVPTPEIIVEEDNIGIPPSFPYISATSELPSIKNNDGTFYYNASNVIDGDYSTCWAEGNSNEGINESIFMSADRKQRVSEIIITNGLYKGSELFYKNNRVKDCQIEFSDGTSQEVTLLGNYSEQSNRIVFDPPVDTEYIKITILSVYYGNKYNDTCITEISVN